MPRLFNGGYSTFFATITAIFASLYIWEVDPKAYEVEQSAIYTQTQHALFDYITNPNNIPQVNSI